MTRNRAAPLVAMIAIIAATLLITVPATAAVTVSSQYDVVAPNVLPAAALDLLAPEVASPPTVAWMSFNQENYQAASLCVARAAPANTATVTNSTVDAKKTLSYGAARAAPLAAEDNIGATYSAAGKASNDFKMDLVIGSARVAPAMNDFKTTAAWTIVAKKTATSYGA